MVTTNFTCDARVTTLRPWNSVADSAAVEFLPEVQYEAGREGRS